MSEETGRVMMMRNHSDKDGSYLVKVSVPDIGIFDIRFNAKDAQHFLQIVQRDYLDRPENHAGSPTYPALQVTDVLQATGASDDGLLVQTAEIGQMVLLSSSDIFQRMKIEIDTVIAAKAQRESRQ